jgi:hypothetical protein
MAVPLDVETVKELKQKIKLARNKELSFALALGKKPEDCALIMHKERGGDKLLLQVKKIDGVQPQKSCFGTLTVDGQLVKLACRSDPPAGLVKNFRIFFRSNGIQMKLAVMAPGDTEFQQEPEETEAVPQSQAQAEPQAEALAEPAPAVPAEPGGTGQAEAAATQELAALKARLARCRDAIAPLSGPVQAKLVEGLKRAVGLLSKGESSKVAALLTQLEKALEQVAKAQAAKEEAAKDETGPQDLGAEEHSAPGETEAAEPETATEDPAAGRWQQAFSKLEPHVTRVLAETHGEIAKIQALWDYGKGKAATGDFTAALKSVGPLSTLLAQAAEAAKAARAADLPPPDEVATETAPTEPAPLAQSGPKPPEQVEQGASGPKKESETPDKPDVEDPAKKQALAKIETARGEMTRVQGLIASFGAPAPGPWATAMQRAAALLGIAPEKKVAELEQAAADATRLMVALEPQVKELSEDKKTWAQTYPLFTARLVPIKAHAMKSIDPVKTKLEAMEAEITAAQAEAAKFDFKKASGGIVSFLSRGDALEAQADDLAHYRKIQADRLSLVTPRRTKASTRAPIQASIDELGDTYDEGVTKAGAEDYEAAVRLMNKIPALADQVDLLLKRERSTTWLLGKVNTALTTLNALPANVKAVLQAGIDRCQAAYDACQPGVEPDVIKAAEKLTLARRECNDLEARGKKAKGYVDQRAVFDARLNDFKAHAGKAGIDDVIAGMEAASASAASDAILRKFDSATRILAADQGNWPAYKTRADDYLAYKTKRDALEARLAALRKLPEAAAATAELAICDGHLRAAGTHGATRDYKSALDSVIVGDAAADVAKNLIEMRAELAKLKKDDVLAAVDKDVVAAFKTYGDLEKYVEGKDGGTFASLRAAAAAEAQKGRDASMGASPDLGKVRDHLAAAIKALENVLNQVACKGSFTSLRTTVAPIVETELPTANTANDTCLATEVHALTQLLTAADDAVKAPGLDFSTGLAKLNEAQQAVPGARQKLALYIESKPLKTQLADAERRLIRSRDKSLTYTNPIAAKQSLQFELDRITGYGTSFDTDWAAGKYRASVAKLKADVKRAKAYEATRADHVETIRRRQKWILDREALIAGDPLLAAERKQVDEAKVAIAGLLEQRAHAPAHKISASTYHVIKRGQEMLTARTAYELKRVAAEAKVQEAEAELAKVTAKGELAAQVVALRSRYAAGHAETAVDKRRFDFAEAEMDALATTACQPVIDAAKAMQLFEDSCKAVAVKVQEVKDHTEAKYIAPLIARLEGKYANMMELAAAGHLSQAKALLAALPQDCADALVAAQNNAALAGIGDDLASIGGDDTAAITAAIEKLRAVFDALKWESEAEYAKTLETAERQVDAIEEQLKTEPKAAKTALPEALKACEALQEEISHHKQLDALATRVLSRITDKTAPFVKYSIIQEDVDALKAEVTAALKGAQAGGDLTTASAAIEAVMDKHHALMRLAARHDQLIKDCDGLETQHQALMGSEYRYAIREDLEQLDGGISQAREAAAKRDHDAAEAHLKTAQARAVDATAKDKMAGNVAPEPENIKAILERPGGDKQLDEMIKGLDASVQRKVLRVAFEAKYGCKLNIYTDASGKPSDRHAAGNIQADGAKKGPNIRRLYEVMSVLPAKDTRDNDSMKIFGYEDVKTQEGSVYSGGVKEVVMREGNANLSSVYGFGRPHEVGEVDDNCKPADQEQVDFFSWNTLHEAGHAVDDQRSFMTGVAGNAAYGGWQEHGKNIKPVADAIADHYDYDTNYVAQYISGIADPAEPECPADVDPETWARRRSKCRAYVDMARAGNDPWQSAAIAAKLNIAGRVYHESYKSGTWNSYAFAARKQAITGYQFRAPGEWFSELYAAYHSKKLKDQHPAVDWLKKLV